MKAKVLLMGAIVATSVISCSTERDEQTNENPAEAVTVEKLEVKKLKPINKDSGTVNKTTSDTIVVSPPRDFTPQSGGTDTGIDPTPIPDPSDPEIIPPGDVRPPKK